MQNLNIEVERLENVKELVNALGESLDIGEKQEEVKELEHKGLEPAI